MVSDSGMNSVSEKFKEFFRCLNIDKIVNILISPPEQWPGGGMHNIFEIHHQEVQTNNDVHFALLQIRLTPVGTGFPSPAMRLINRSIRALLPQIGRKPLNIHNDDKHYEALKSRQEA